ncbi:MAG: hypothetical protein K2I63_03960 [Helicobacter sp.]|nr:hypothetical protein [Helicobacter sp.]
MLREDSSIDFSFKEKEELLSSLEDISQEKNIPFKAVGIVLVFMFCAYALLMPKIYIRNHIYFVSRDIIQLQTQLDSLYEENKHIKKQLEDIKFKNLTHELDF